MTANMELLAHRVEKWAKERGLENPNNSTAQALKLFEEAGELAQAHLKNREADGKDAVGDILVVLTIYKAGFFWGNVVKYVLRFHKKNGVEDLKKAEFYLKRLIEELEYGSRK